MSPSEPPRPRAEFRERLRIIIFEADTPAGKAFDVGLFVAIVLSMLAVMLESVEPIEARHGSSLRAFEWLMTGLFSIEYVLRLASVERPLRYAFSFFGLVDLLSIVPTYLSLFLPGTQSLLVIRTLRLLRIFRVFKLYRFLGEANVLRTALTSSRHKVLVFLGTVLLLDVILGAAMFVIEGPANGFTSIPRSMYWAIVTMTTVGYGDISPHTVPGQILASLAMIIGYSIIAIPTGIVSAEMVQATQVPTTTRCCPSCLSEGHLPSARFCRDCGEKLGDGA